MVLREDSLFVEKCGIIIMIWNFCNLFLIFFWNVGILYPRVLHMYRTTIIICLRLVVGEIMPWIYQNRQVKWACTNYRESEAKNNDLIQE